MARSKNGVKSSGNNATAIRCTFSKVAIGPEQAAVCDMARKFNNASDRQEDHLHVDLTIRDRKDRKDDTKDMIVTVWTDGFINTDKEFVRGKGQSSDKGLPAGRYVCVDALLGGIDMQMDNGDHKTISLSNLKVDGGDHVFSQVMNVRRDPNYQSYMDRIRTTLSGEIGEDDRVKCKCCNRSIKKEPYVLAMLDENGNYNKDDPRFFVVGASCFDNLAKESGSLSFGKDVFKTNKEKAETLFNTVADKLAQMGHDFTESDVSDEVDAKIIPSHNKSEFYVDISKYLACAKILYEYGLAEGNMPVSQVSNFKQADDVLYRVTSSIAQDKPALRKYDAKTVHYDQFARNTLLLYNSLEHVMSGMYFEFDDKYHEAVSHFDELSSDDVFLNYVQRMFGKAVGDDFKNLSVWEKSSGQLLHNPALGAALCQIAAGDCQTEAVDELYSSKVDTKDCSLILGFAGHDRSNRPCVFFDALCSDNINRMFSIVYEDVHSKSDDDQKRHEFVLAIDDANHRTIADGTPVCVAINNKKFRAENKHVPVLLYDPKDEKDMLVYCDPEPLEERVKKAQKRIKDAHMNFADLKQRALDISRQSNAANREFFGYIAVANDVLFNRGTNLLGNNQYIPRVVTKLSIIGFTGKDKDECRKALETVRDHYRSISGGKLWPQQEPVRNEQLKYYTSGNTAIFFGEKEELDLFTQLMYRNSGLVSLSDCKSTEQRLNTFKKQFPDHPCVDIVTNLTANELKAACPCVNSLFEYDNFRAIYTSADRAIQTDQIYDDFDEKVDKSIAGKECYYPDRKTYYSEEFKDETAGLTINIPADESNIRLDPGIIIADDAECKDKGDFGES